MRTPEGREKDKLKKWLREGGIWFFSPFMRGYGQTGVPDLIACWDGKLIGLEVKAEGKKPTKQQERCLAEIRKAGGLAYWGTAAQLIEEMLWIGRSKNHFRS